MAGWSRGDKLALCGVILAIIGLLFLFPQVRAAFGIDKPDVVLCLQGITAETGPSLSPERKGQDARISYALLNRGSASTTIIRVHFDVSGTAPWAGEYSHSASFSILIHQDIDGGKASSPANQYFSHVLTGDIITFQEVSTLVYWSGGQGKIFQNMHSGSLTNDPGCPIV